jgi:hypothetical protein
MINERDMAQARAHLTNRVRVAGRVGQIVQTRDARRDGAAQAV